MIRIVRWYLAAFAWLAADRAHARAEHRMLVGGLLDAYDEARSAGHRHVFAAVWAIWIHLPELQPLALIVKTRADACIWARSARSGLPGWASTKARRADDPRTASGGRYRRDDVRRQWRSANGPYLPWWQRL